MVLGAIGSFSSPDGEGNAMELLKGVELSDQEELVLEQGLSFIENIRPKLSIYNCFWLKDSNFPYPLKQG
ncbi:MAG: hypothetical protein Fur006_24620 [Coleofasciculaceae cyanobacterium]